MLIARAETVPVEDEEWTALGAVCWSSLLERDADQAVRIFLEEGIDHHLVIRGR